MLRNHTMLASQDAAAVQKVEIRALLAEFHSTLATFAYFPTKPTEAFKASITNYEGATLTARFTVCLFAHVACVNKAAVVTEGL